MRPRSGSAQPKTRKRCLQVACTNLLTNYFLSDRSPATFKTFVFPDLTSVVVHDRGLGAVPDDAKARDVQLVQHGVRVGLSQVPRSPGANVEQPPRPPGSCCKCLRATRHRHAVRGYISTAAKHGISVFAALRDALTGTPGCHPFPPAPKLRPQPVTQRNASGRHA